MVNRRNIIINESQLSVLREFENSEVLRHEFETKVRNYMKQLMENPCKPKFDQFFSENGIREDVLQNKMIDLDLIKRQDKIDEPEDANGEKHSMHTRKFIFSSQDFDDKIGKLYDTFFKNGVRTMNEEDGGGCCAGGFAGPSAGGATNAMASGQYDVPFAGVMRRKNGKKRSTAGKTSNVDMTDALSRPVGGVAVNRVNESRYLNSKKLIDILNQHGGIMKSYKSHGIPGTTDLKNMGDNDVIGVMSPQQVQAIQQGHTVDHWRWGDNYGLDKWARQNDIELEKGDRVETIKLGDGNYLIYIERNAEFEHSGREGGYKRFATTQHQRSRNSWLDGKNSFQPMSTKGKDANTIRANSYFSNKEGIWGNPENRRKAVDNIKVGKNPWDFETT